MSMNCMKTSKINYFVIGGLILLLTLSATTPNEKNIYVEISTRFGKMKVMLYNETPQHRDNFIKLVKEGFYDSLMFHRIIPDYTISGGDPKTRFATEDSVVGDGDLGYRIPFEYYPGLMHKRGALAAARDQNPTFASNPSQFFIVWGKTYTIKELKKIENFRNQIIKSNILYTISQADTTKARMNDYNLRGDKEGLKKYVSSFQSVADTIYARTTPFTFNSEQIVTYTTLGGLPQLDSGYTVFGEVVSGLHIIDSIIRQPRTKSDRPVKDIRMKIRIIKN